MSEFRPLLAGSELRFAARNHPIERVGEELREMMPFITAGKQRVEDASGG